MGTIAIVILRSTLQFIAIVLSIASGIILVRRLDTHSYALYQSITKRVSGYVAGFIFYPLEYGFTDILFKTSKERLKR